MGTIELTLSMLELAALFARLALIGLAVTELADKAESTLNTELVAVKEPVVIEGVVPAMDIVGVLERPWAPPNAVLTELVAIAGITLESDDDSVGKVPETS